MLIARSIIWHLQHVKLVNKNPMKSMCWNVHTCSAIKTHYNNIHFFGERIKYNRRSTRFCLQKRKPNEQQPNREGENKIEKRKKKNDQQHRNENSDSGSGNSKCKQSPRLINISLSISFGVHPCRTSTNTHTHICAHSLTCLLAHSRVSSQHHAIYVESFDYMHC